VQKNTTPKNTIRRKPKKFRFQIIHQWLTENFEPCNVLDVGGGKGLLSYLLGQSGWRSVVLDPEIQALPTKYTDLNKKKIKIPSNESVEYIEGRFYKEAVKDFDLIIGLHAHGSNMMIIDACKEYDKDFLLLPCCVIDEPIIKRPAVNWRESLKDYATEQGFDVKEVKFGFMGKDMAIYSDRRLVKGFSR
jgi:hypothetical protein